jgi:type III pantothenate kinase
MSRLVIDVGNTTIAYGAFDDDIKNPQRINTDSIQSASDLATIVDSATEIVVACGVERIKELFSELKKYTFNYVSGTQPGGAIIDYDTPETLGPDRVANAIAARDIPDKPVLVIDCGTAITIDVIDENGTFIGGLISPGLITQRDALVNAAPSLPEVELASPQASIGRDTITSIQAGVIDATARMIDSTIDDFTKKYLIKSVILTGGDSHILFPLLRSHVIHDEWFTLVGLGLAEI